MKFEIMKVLCLGSQFVKIHEKLPLLVAFMLHDLIHSVRIRLVGHRFLCGTKWFHRFDFELTLGFVVFFNIIGLILIIILCRLVLVVDPEEVIVPAHRDWSKNLESDKIINYRLVFIKFIILPMPILTVSTLYKGRMYFFLWFDFDI